MALLEDPTIQRILDEVNKAASGGILGIAGNYISDSRGTITQFDHQLMPSEKNHFNQDQPPIFYPTPEMFGINNLTNTNLNSMPSVVSMASSSNFDLYTAGLHNTMPQNFLSYENYNDIAKSKLKHQVLNNNPIRSVSSLSSTNNDPLFEHHRRQEYSTIPSTVPNLGLDIRTTPQLDSIPNDITDSDEIQLISEQIPKETINTSPSPPTTNFISDKDDNHSLPPINNDENDQQNLISAGKIFYDPNPEIIQRKGSHSVTYKQNIIVRFLQPPPISNAGPLIIKEVRASKPPPLPPLVIKQRPTPPKTPPPIVIREKPPPHPPILATKVITRQLPPEPAPPRAVIIERLPPLPPKPRDIIIERWLPYEIINQKRKVIVQHVPKNPKEQSQPKNVIITYEPVEAKIIRNFQKQKVTREDPQAYSNRYGSQLYDPNLVVQKARAIGVVEDLNPPISYIATTSNSVATTTDYDLPVTTAVNANEQEKNNVEKCEKVEENNTQQQLEEKPIQISATSSVHTEENTQEEDILVEENVTPFYINSGENLQQTLQRLGIDLAENARNEYKF